ncbi:MAG: hypothetical protein HN900_18205 [Gammaproteobacteria bacterium]|nr:hypothetical protein [Gammaproteobacteria bacterium]MBT6667973.1 hypothetical protein [Gammaproteobacteria bacterium]MBT7176618.1 hypothetical protein [Gammaproteobacteria bacterium]MBT7721589.1 hypothetical protein [Gammaproteobacteria bacterium]
MNRYSVIIAAVSFLLASCGVGSTSGGVGTTKRALYEGTICYSGYNTCGETIPVKGRFKMGITSTGNITFDPLGFAWRDGWIGIAWFGNAISGSSFEDSFISDDWESDWPGYYYGLVGRIRDDGETVSGTFFIEGDYDVCSENISGEFVGTKLMYNSLP